MIQGKTVVGVSVNPEITLHHREAGETKRRVVSRHECISGTSLDVALWLREFGIETTLIGTVGSQGFLVDEVKRSLDERHISALLLPIRERMPLAMISVDEETGVRQHLSDKPPYLPNVQEVAIQQVRDCVTLCTPSFRIATGVMPEDAWLARALLGDTAPEVTRILNPRADLLRPSHRNTLVALVRCADLLILNNQELAFFESQAQSGDVVFLARGAKALHGMGARTIVVTCAEAGSYLFAEGEAPCHEETFVLGSVVDEAGAGDAFLAGLVIGRMQGKTYRESLPFAALLAGFAMTEVGGAVTKPADVVMAKWRELHPDD